MLRKGEKLHMSRGRGYRGNLCTSLSILLASKTALKNRALVSVKVKKSLSCVRLFASPWTMKSMQFSIAWVAFLFSRGSSQPREQTQVSRIVGGFFTSWAIREMFFRAASKTALKNRAAGQCSLRQMQRGGTSYANTDRRICKSDPGWVLRNILPKPLPET